jgi:outer membrane receptor for ferrienterochelin and colicin
MQSKKAILVLTLVIAVFSSLGGTISGKVTDAETGKPLTGATLRIDSIKRSTGTNSEGRYFLNNIPTGRYALKASHVGFAIQVIEDVEVETGMETKVDVRLVSSPIIGKTVEVSTPTRRVQLLEDTPEITMVVRDVDFRKFSPRDISTAVAYLPGVSIEGGTGSGQPDDKIVSINGLPAHYSLVLMDGTRVVSSHWHTGANVNIIPPEAIEQIEVVKGAASAQYGSDGMGGVLNIITKRGDSNRNMELVASGGSRNSQYYALANYGIITDDIKYGTFVGWQKTDGDSILKPAHRLGQLGFDRFTLFQNVDANFCEKFSSRAQMFYMSSHSEFRGEEYESWLITPKIDLEYSAGDDLDFALSGYYTQWNGEINAEKNEIAEPKLTVGYGGFTESYLLAGAEWTYRNFTRTSVPEKSQTAVGIFIQDEWTPTAKLSLLGALRFDKVVNISGVLTPKLTAVFKPNSLVDARLSVGRGFRAPTVQDLYEESYGHGTYRREGNPDLKPEYSTGITGGFEIHPIPRLTVLIDGYYTTLTDMITPAYSHTELVVNPTSGDTSELAIYVRQNIYSAKVMGGEVRLNYNLFRDFALETAFNYTHNENEETGTCLPYYPGITASAKITGFEAIGSKVGMGGFVGVNFAGNRKVWNWNNIAAETELEDFYKLDAGMHLRLLDRFALFGTAENLLGHEIMMFEDAEMIIAGVPHFTFGLRIRSN